MSARTARGVAWSLGGLALALMVGFLVLSALGSSVRGPQVELVDRVVFALFLIYAAVGALVASRHPANPIGWLFLGQGLLFELTGFSLGYVMFALFARPGSLPGGGVMAWIGQWIWIAEFFALPALFFLLFPSGRLTSRRWRPVAWLIPAVGLAGFASAAFSPGSFGGSLSSVVNPFGLDAAEPVLRPLGTVATAVGGPVFIAALASFILRFRGSRAPERQQLKWVAYAGVLMLVSFGIGDLLQTLGLPVSVTSTFWVLPVALIPVAAGVAILGYRLYDIDILISKSVVFGGLVGFATAVYVATVVGIGAVVGRTTKWNVGLAMLATAVVAVAFQPVRDRMHLLARRLVFGTPTTAERQAGLAIHCLGAFRVFRDGEPLPATAWQSKKARTLLKILVARRGRSTTRDYLMEALWPEESPDKLANRLSVALATVRGVLDPNKRHASEHFVVGDKDAVRLDLANLPIDVEQFLAAAAEGLDMHERGEAGEARAKLAAAEGAYDGEFLEEDAYEDWAVPLREEVRMTFIWVSRALAEMAERSAAIDDANRHYLRILEKDPWDQGAHLALVRALERAGRHGEARRRYRAYVSRMEEIDLPFAPFPITQRP